MQVWLVLDEDRGCGPFVVGVFASLEAAEAYVAGPNGSNCYVYSPFPMEVQCY